MPIITLPDDGEENWSGELRTAILAVNSAVDETAALVGEHIISENPHAEYDDLPSLTLLFENGLI